MTVWANRIIILLGWLGIFIASVMSYSKYANLLVPCSTGASCAVVGFSEFSTIGPVPVAYLGLCAYFVLTGLAVYRVLEPKAWIWTARIGLYMSVAGFLFSAFLTYMSLVALKTTCEWCIGSFATMTGMFLTHAIVMKGGEVPTTQRRIDWAACAVAGVLAITGFGYNSGLMGGTKGGTPIEMGSLTPDDVMGPAYKRKGNADAKVTVVEFADFNCPACRRSKVTMDGLYTKYQGRMRYCYRSFPLNIPGHESSLVASRMAEIAGLRGKYWEFVDSVFEPGNTERIKDADGVGLRQVATGVGIDAKELNDALASETDPSIGALADDMGMAMKSLRLASTPSFILMTVGTQPRLVKVDDLGPMLESEPYKSLLAK